MLFIDVKIRVKTNGKDDESVAKMMSGKAGGCSLCLSFNHSALVCYILPSFAVVQMLGALYVNKHQ